MKILLLAAAWLVPVLASARSIEIPVDVGAGPSVFGFYGPVFADQPIHFGLRFAAEAVIDQEWIRTHQRDIPPKYRKQAAKVTELRVGPSIFIPDSLIISPKIRNTGIYGVNWKPIGLNFSLARSKSAQVRIPLQLNVMYAFLHSDLFPTTHFIRPGASVGLDIELKATNSFLVSFGYNSQFYVPQELGTLGIGPLNNSIWHVGQAYLMFHVRFPYKVSL